MIILRNIVLFLLALGGLAYLFGPYEDVSLTANFDESLLDQGVAAHFATVEARHDNITPGVEKQVIWAADAEAKTPWAVLYLHGFSATSREIRPVPESVAVGLGANLILTRLQGHGQDGAALADATVQGWMQDVAEGLAVARRIGDRVLIIATSTGGTLATAAVLDDTLKQRVAGVVMVSPNFGIQNPLAPLLTFPAARYWLPMLAGKDRAFEPRNDGQAKYWTTAYPSVAVLPMAALVKKVSQLDVSEAGVPAFFFYAPEDQVVRSDLTGEIAARWGGPVKTLHPELGAEDDPYAHVIAGDIMSPGQTSSAVTAILDWAKEL